MFKKHIYIALLLLVVMIVGAGCSMKKVATTGAVPVMTEAQRKEGVSSVFESLITNDIDIRDDLTLTDDFTIGGDITQNTIKSGWVTGSCADATTTTFSVANPLSADTYVDTMLLELTNGTTTITFDVGTSSTAYAAPSEAFMDDVSSATSTVLLVKNMSGSASAVYGFTDPGTNSQDLALWRSGEYINMTVTETGSTGGVTNAQNTFSCVYKIHYVK